MSGSQPLREVGNWASNWASSPFSEQITATFPTIGRFSARFPIPIRPGPSPVCAASLASCNVPNAVVGRNFVAMDLLPSFRQDPVAIRHTALLEQMLIDQHNRCSPATGETLHKLNGELPIDGGLRAVSVGIQTKFSDQMGTELG